MNLRVPSLLSFLSEVVTRLASAGLGTAGQNIFYSQLPPKPVKCIAVVLQPGLSRIGEPLVRVETQILVRDDAYGVGLQKAQAIFDLFQHEVPLSIVRARVTPLSSPGVMYKDENGFFVFSTNYAWVLNPV